LTVCLAPGELRLPKHRSGTLVLHDASALTLDQQIDLYDWMSDRDGTIQVIAVTSIPLWSLVERGQYLEGLFHRLNVVHMRATAQDIH
jgi:DNA-binding NtrC family response regulator